MSQQKLHQPLDTQGYPESNSGYLTHQNILIDKPINLRKYLFLFLRNWYWFLITLGIAFSIAFFKIRYSIPQYQASATLIIEDEETSQDMMSQLRAVRYWRRQSDLANESAKLSAFTLIKRTVDTLHQDVFWTAHGRIRIRPLYKNPRFQLTIVEDSVNWYKGKEWFIDYIDNETFRLYKEELLDTILPLETVIELDRWHFFVKLISDTGHGTYSFVVNDLISLTKSYKQKLRIESDEKMGTILTLLSQGPVGEREVDFLNTLSYIYIYSELERKQKIAENTFLFIDEQINVILDSLRNAENQLLTFRLSNNVINLSREGEIAFERLKSFHEQQTTLKLRENYYKYLKKYIEDRNDPLTVIVPTLSNDEDQLLSGTVKNLQELYEERESMDLSVSASNPGLENINGRIEGIGLRIVEIVNGLIENNRLTQEQINTEEQAILDQLKTLPLSEQQLLNIKRKYDLYNQFYTFLLQRRAEAGIQKASAISNVRILDPARNDQLMPVGSDKKVLLVIAMLLGILTPAVIIILRDLLDNRIRDREDIENNSNISIIGTIGHASDVGILPIKETPHSAFTESLRRIRSNLDFTLRGKDQKVIMVTSTISGEGKTFSASNIAAIIAMNHKKVLLIGCDLRRPTLHRIFNVNNEYGITSYLIGFKKLEEIILPTDIENLFIIPSGPVPPNPAELIDTKEMKDLFTQLKKDFDYLVIDTPPLALVADALSLASYTDITLYIVRQNHSHKQVLEVANAMEKEERLPQLFLLINDLHKSRSMGYDYYYGYGRGYSYDYEYNNYFSPDNSKD